MRRLWMLLLLAGCASPAPPAPPDPEDRAALQKRLRDALDAPFVMGKFYAEYEVGGRIRAKCRGTARAFRSGVVMIEEETESGPPLRLLRVGERAWHYREGWLDAAGTPWAGLGTGFQDPYEVLGVLETAAGQFVPHRQGGMSCKGGNILGPLTNRAGVAPPQGTEVDGVLKTGFREGSLVTRFSSITKVNGAEAAWIAKLDIVGWGGAPPMTFDDIPAPFTSDMKAAVRKATEGK